MDRQRLRELGLEAAAALAPVAVLLFGVRRVLPTLGSGLWGPEQPFLQGDFTGGWWLWWARSSAGSAELVGFPEGIQSVAPYFPNPLQMSLLGLLMGPPTALAWNLVQLSHLVLLVLSTVVLARVAGAGRLASAGAAALVAASPVLLHEVVGGRPDDLVVWPGLLALACLWKGGRWAIAAGLLAALQGTLYAWHGVVLLLAGLCLIRSRRDALVAGVVGALAVTPYLIWLSWGLSTVPTDTPDAGYTALPLAGLWPGEWGMPERFLVHPLLLSVSLLGVRGGRRWLGAGLLALLLALGPGICWLVGDEPLVSGPWAWVAWAIPGAARMHHPLRAVLLALPLLAVATALGVERMRWGPWLAGGLGLAALAHAPTLEKAAAYDVDPVPPFAEVQVTGPGLDLLGAEHKMSLALQTVHGQPVMELPSQRREDPVIQALAAGVDPGPAFWVRLREQGIREVWVFDRRGDGDAARAVVEQALGEPVRPGVYEL